MIIEIKASRIKEVGFSLQGPSHMVITASMDDHQMEYLMSQWWEFNGDDFFKKYFAAEGYELIKKGGSND